MQHLLKNVRFLHLRSEVDFTNGSSYLMSRPVDMNGFEGVVFMAQGTSKCGRAATTKTNIRVLGAAATSGPWFDMANTSSTAAWSSASFAGKTLLTDYYKPLSTQRWLRASVAGASTESLLGIWGIQYGSRVPGSTNMWKSSTRAGSSKWLSTRLAQKFTVSTTAGSAATT